MTPNQIVSIHTDVSQLDDAVFDAWGAGQGEPKIDLLFWNDYGLSRRHPDRELGVVPEFPTPEGKNPNVRRSWLDRRTVRMSELIQATLERRPRAVLLNDLDLKTKLRLSFALRRAGVSVGFRSDKNQLSLGARRGARQAFERLVYALSFDFFCPASRLAAKYYRWPKSRPQVLFPYATDVEKFSSESADRLRPAIRQRLGLSPSSKMLLCVAKFVDREGVADVIKAYLSLPADVEDVDLVVVGAGPKEAEFRALAASAGSRVKFVGYVPYAQLQDYFFAADVFVHLAHREPWGVSVSDALSAGLGVVASDAVGAAVELMDGDLARFVTPVGNVEAAATALRDALALPDIASSFEPAREMVLATYSNVATARRLASLGAQ